MTSDRHFQGYDKTTSEKVVVLVVTAAVARINQAKVKGTNNNNNNNNKSNHQNYYHCVGYYKVRTLLDSQSQFSSVEFGSVGLGFTVPIARWPMK